MAGMLQIITYLLAVYLVVKGIEVLQIAYASPREEKRGPIILGVITLGLCVLAAVFFVVMQDAQATSLSTSMPSLPSY
jgi:uncharacterized membrane protein HdeD (DUF308 family)